jgi:hypothetical protein
MLIQIFLEEINCSSQHLLQHFSAVDIKVSHTGQDKQLCVIDYSRSLLYIVCRTKRIVLGSNQQCRGFYRGSTIEGTVCQEAESRTPCCGIFPSKLVLMNQNIKPWHAKLKNISSYAFWQCS